MSIFKKAYDATIGKKTVLGAIVTVGGFAVGGPIGAGLVEVGKIVLVVGLGDKAVRAVAEKYGAIGSVIGGLIGGLKNKDKESK